VLGWAFPPQSLAPKDRSFLYFGHGKIVTYVNQAGPMAGCAPLTHFHRRLYASPQHTIRCPKRNLSLFGSPAPWYRRMPEQQYLVVSDGYPDDAGRPGPGEIAGNGKDDDGNGYVDDVYGWDFDRNDKTVFDGVSDDHGTHVAGTIGAVGGNAAGVAGVCWSVKLLVAKFLGTRGGYSKALYDAIERANSAGILFVAAADNSSSNNDAVASYSGTSMATPHVTGAAALYAATHPGSTAADIKAAILSAAVPTASLAGKCVTGGRLNVSGF